MGRQCRQTALHKEDRRKKGAERKQLHAEDPINLLYDTIT